MAAAKRLGSAFYECSWDSKAEGNLAERRRRAEAVGLTFSNSMQQCLFSACIGLETAEIARELRQKAQPGILLVYLLQSEAGGACLRSMGVLKARRWLYDRRGFHLSSGELFKSKGVNAIPETTRETSPEVACLCETSMQLPRKG